MEPYYADESVTLFMGDCREVVPALGLTADCIVADPPYGETSLSWDRWPDDWPTAMTGVAKSMWCFGSMRMFLDRRDQFTGWRLSQDVVWEKHNGSGFAADRFRRLHEHATHWYRGGWEDVHHDLMAEPTGRRSQRIERGTTPHLGTTGRVGETGATRLPTSVIRVRSMHGIATHPTEKPVGILDPLIRYACPPGGTVLDPFAGSGSTAEAARLTGRKAILVEADERYCQAIARRMSQGVLMDEPEEVG